MTPWSSKHQGCRSDRGVHTAVHADGMLLARNRQASRQIRSTFPSMLSNSYLNTVMVPCNTTCFSPTASTTHRFSIRRELSSVSSLPRPARTYLQPTSYSSVEPGPLASTSTSQPCGFPSWKFQLRSGLLQPSSMFSCISLFNNCSASQSLILLRSQSLGPGRNGSVRPEPRFVN